MIAQWYRKVPTHDVAREAATKESKEQAKVSFDRASTRKCASMTLLVWRCLGITCELESMVCMFA